MGGAAHKFILESNEGKSDIYYDNRLLNISIDQVNLDNKLKNIMSCN